MASRAHIPALSPMTRSVLFLLFHLPMAGIGYAESRAARYVDDEKLMKSLEKSLLKLAEDGKVTRGKDLLGQMTRKTCDVPPAAPSAAVLAPEEIYTGCAGGVVMISSAWKSDEGEGWEAGEPATAWILTPDGVLITNYHVFADAEKEEVFGVMTQSGHFYPVMEILAADRLNDIAVFKIHAKGLQPLALSMDEPVGKRVYVISHPDRQFYTFTQGEITRYTIQYDEEKAPGVKYMSITADFARGSSGGPVLNDHGAVVGMVCSTRTTYYDEKRKNADNDVQMVVKFCIPGESMRALLKKTPVLSPRTEAKEAPVPLRVEAVPDLPGGPAAAASAPRDNAKSPPVPKAEPVPEPP